jgi:hypothetical protein
MYEGVAFAEHYTGPYTRLTPTAPLDLPESCEDPGVYFDKANGVFRMVLHCGCEVQLMWSKDGVSWTKQGVERKTGWCSGFNYTDGGGPKQLQTRQRPKWITNKDGAATHLTTGVNRVGDIGMGHTWTMAARLVNSSTN